MNPEDRDCKIVWMPTPPGPYLVIHQHQAVQVERMSWDQAVKTYSAFLEQELPKRMWGEVAFANVEGLAVTVAYHYDSSD